MVRNAILEHVIIISIIQIAIASIEMESKTSIIQDVKTQEDLQVVANSLYNYIAVGLAWLVFSSIVMYGEFSTKGAMYAILLNGMFITLITLTYLHAFRKVMAKYGLKSPKINPPFT